MAKSHRSTAKSLWHVLFEFKGSIWLSVLPFCILNCSIMVIVELLALRDIKIAFSPSGHGLMTLIISFLGLAKVNLSYDRYMSCRHSIGHALSSLRELNQIALTFTQRRSGAVMTRWREEVTTRIVDVIDCTIRVLKDDNQTDYLARNDCPELNTDDDPMLYVQALRSRLYNASFGDGQDFQLLEKMKMLDMLNEFDVHYRNLLKWASTPLPFPLVQMGRTFLFLWTFTIPFVLRGVVEEKVSAMIFVFFLTYGFIGLEIVAMKLLDPFGDGVNDLNVTGMRQATVIGIENDLRLFDETATVGDKRSEFRRQKPRPPTVDMYDSGGVTMGGDDFEGPSGGHTNFPFHSMGDDHIH